MSSETAPPLRLKTKLLSSSRFIATIPLSILIFPQPFVALGITRTCSCAKSRAAPFFPSDPAHFFWDFPVANFCEVFSLILVSSFCITPSTWRVCLQSTSQPTRLSLSSHPPPYFLHLWQACDLIPSPYYLNHKCPPFSPPYWSSLDLFFRSLFVLPSPHPPGIKSGFSPLSSLPRLTWCYHPISFLLAQPGRPKDNGFLRSVPPRFYIPRTLPPS